MMPLMSQVGREETCSIRRRSFSPAGIERPIGFRNEFRRQIEILPLRQDVRRQVLHAVVEAGNGDVAVVVMQAAENTGQHPDRVLRAAAEDAGMQIAVGGLDLDLVIDEPAQRGGDRRRVLVPHAGVADQREVGLQVGLVLLEERHEVLRADFFLALDDDGDVDRQRSRHRLPGAAGLDEGHQLPLVVLGAARDDDLAAVGMVGHDRLERRTVPQVQRIDRLHIVMAVEQHVRPTAGAAIGIAVVLGDDRRMPRRRPHLRREAERRDVLGQMIGGRLAVAGKGGIGRDRLDPQQRKQPLETVVEIGVDAVEDRLKLCVGHHWYPLAVGIVVASICSPLVA